MLLCELRVNWYQKRLLKSTNSICLGNYTRMSWKKLNNSVGSQIIRSHGISKSKKIINPELFYMMISIKLFLLLISYNICSVSVHDVVTL